MAKLSEVLTALINEHEIVEPPLEKALDAAFHLCIDPAGPRAERDCQHAYSFVFGQVLPHLRTEEEKLFPEALAAGFSSEVLMMIEQDHSALRTLAQRLEHAGLVDDAAGLSDEAALLFSRFVEATRWHMAREESIFQEFLAEEQRARADTDPPKGG